jgi:hypothetical protein
MAIHGYIAINPHKQNGMICYINIWKSWDFMDPSFLSTTCLAKLSPWYVGSFSSPILDKKMFRLSKGGTYEACGFKILCWLFGCCFNHKCYQMPLACSHLAPWLCLFLQRCAKHTFTYFFQCAWHPKCVELISVAIQPP